MSPATEPAAVAVVVPCFEQGAFLPEAVASALEQTHPPVEVVVVDDGSQDGSLRVARVLAADTGGRVRVIARENGGLPVARNTGIAATDASYVCCLDADDALTPTYLERCVAALEARPDVSIAYGGQQNFGEDSTFHPHGPFDFRTQTVVNLLGVASVFRRAAWAAAGGYASMDSYEDWDFWIGCCERGHSALHVPDAVFRYRVRPGSMYAEATKRDARLKAQVVLNHSDLYSPRQVAWADAVLAGDAAAAAVPAALGHVPLFAGDTDPLVGWRPLEAVACPDLGETRSLLVGVLLAELAADPTLLAAYWNAVGPEDDATLVVVAPDRTAPEATGTLERVAAAAHVRLDDGPDAVLCCGSRSPAELRLLSFRLGALLARRRPPQDLAVPPRVGSVDELRSLLAVPAAA